jgi:hypothetical protein
LAAAFVAAACLVAAGLLQRPLDTRSVQYGLVAPQDVVAQRHWGVRVLSMAPGGLRAIAVNWLWMRAEQLKQMGQHHEAVQLANMICMFQPHFPGVWAFQYWNLAWNISVQTHTPEERWLWVSKGMSLLRDQGIPLNPRSLELYKELGWLFANKIAGDLDDMHVEYKRRWASEMQRLLAAPPLGTTAETIEAFRPIAQAPVDYDPRRQARQLIQGDKLAELLRDPDVAAFAAKAHAMGIRLDWSLLDAYNRFTLEAAVQSTRTSPPPVETDADRAVAELVNSPALAPGRDKALAFVRAQILWNEYRMDSRWMLELMEFHNIPLDWRLAMAHCLYWVSYGIHQCDSLNVRDITSINTDRVLLIAMKELTWRGRLDYTENRDNPEQPTIYQWPDYRYILPTRREFDRLSEAVRGGVVDKFYETADAFQAAHVNYMITAIEMLYTLDKRADAKEQMDYLKARYGFSGGEWEQDVQTFVVERMNRDGTPVAEVALSQLAAAIVSAHVRLANDDAAGYQQYMAFAHDAIYRRFWNNDTPQRLLAERPPFGMLTAKIVGDLLCRPESLGVRFDPDPSKDVAVRSRLYRSLSPDFQATVYPPVERALRPLARRLDLDFDKAFPKP